MKRKIVIVVALLIAVLLISLAVHHRSESGRHERIVNFFGHVPPLHDNKIVARQLELASLPLETINPDYQPVHIVRRKNSDEPWIFIGTGTLLTKKSDVMVTAHHVIESAMPMQLGYRHIGEEEWTGTAKVKPITGILNANEVGDAVLCAISMGDVFPPMDVKPRFGDKAGIKTDTRVPMDMLLPGVVVRFLTEPSRKIPCLCTSLNPNGVRAYIFDFDPQPGESGTGAIVEYRGEQKFIVVTHHHPMSGEALVQLGLTANISESRMLGIGHCLDFTYNEPSSDPDKDKP